MGNNSLRKKINPKVVKDIIIIFALSVVMGLVTGIVVEEVFNKPEDSCIECLKKKCQPWNDIVMKNDNFHPESNIEDCKTSVQFTYCGCSDRCPQCKTSGDFICNENIILEEELAKCNLVTPSPTSTPT